MLEKMWRRDHCCTIGGKLNWAATTKNSTEVPWEFKNRPTTSNPTPGYICKGNEMFSKKYLYSYVHSSIIYDSKEMETT